ncbi:hypothetical protein F4808DRAFT_465830 [Astrocystis sublimbata]|nr:hypothetical protein F4808DRAFT_465830 [Astrocystis sublimbata]
MTSPNAAIALTMGMLLVGITLLLGAMLLFLRGSRRHHGFDSSSSSSSDSQYAVIASPGCFAGSSPCSAQGPRGAHADFEFPGHPPPVVFQLKLQSRFRFRLWLGLRLGF